MDQSNLNIDDTLPLIRDHLMEPSSIVDYKQMVDKLESLSYENKRLNMVNHLVAGLAHEIRNPLTIMKGFLQIIKPDLDRIQKSDIADLLLSEIHRTNELIEEFLDSARPTEHILNKMNLIPFLRNILLLFQSEAIINRCSLTSNLNELTQPLDVMIDSGQLKQVFLNLIKNSIEAIRHADHEKGSICLSVYKRLRTVDIHIQDNGIGMDTMTLSKLFQPFYTTKKKGTGLGLFL
ncbi:MAG: ATP-binding protein, partial [Anaerobacillus sp.]